MNLDTPTAWLVALNVAFPLLAGFFTVGAFHEPLHRSLSLTLPGIRTRQRQATVFTLGVVALVATVGTAGWSQSGVSPLASFGLAFGLGTLPSLNQYRRLGGQAGTMAAVAGWFLISYFAGSGLVLAMRELPWLFFIGGLAGGTASIIAGFSRRRTRARADALFIAPQTGICSYLLHRGMVAGWQAEVWTKLKPNQQVKPGQDWNQKSVNSHHGWWTVLWHAQFGAVHRGSFLRVHLHIVIASIAGALTMAGVASGFSPESGYWKFVAQCVAPNMEVFRAVKAAGPGGVFAMMLPVMASLYVLIQLSPPIFFPISRRRLAQLAFGHALRQWAVALILPAASLWLLSCVGQFLSGGYRHALGLSALVSTLVPLAALLPWLVITGTIRRPLYRVLAAIPVCMAILVFAVVHPLQKAALTPSGLAVVVLLTAGSLALLRHRLYRDYAMADLTQSSGLAQFMGLNFNR